MKKLVASAAILACSLLPLAAIADEDEGRADRSQHPITLAVSAVLLHRAGNEDRGRLALSDLGVDERRAARAARFANTDRLRRSIDPTAR